MQTYLFPKLIDYSKSIVNQLNELEPAINGLAYGRKNLFNRLKAFCLVRDMAELTALERNIQTGLNAYEHSIPYEPITNAVADRLKSLKSTCAAKKEQAFKALSMAVEQISPYNEAGYELYINSAASYCLCLAYGFGCEKDLMKSRNTLDSLALAEALETESQAMIDYFHGLSYFIDSLIAIESGKRLPFILGGLCKSGNPWVALAHYETLARDARLLRYNTNRWRLNECMNDLALLTRFDPHTLNRLKFCQSMETANYLQIYDEGLQLGFASGLRQDADAAARLLLTAARRGVNPPNLKGLKTASLLGYRAASAMLAHIEAASKKNRKRRHFELFLLSQKDHATAFSYGTDLFYSRAVDASLPWIKKCADEGYRPAQAFLAHEMKDFLSREEGLEWLRRHGESDENSRLELFDELNSDLNPKNLSQALNIAVDLHFRYGRLAQWLGDHYFSGKDYPNAAKAYAAGHELHYLDSSISLAHCLLHGYGVPENQERALNLLGQAASQSQKALICYALCAVYGLGPKLTARQIADRSAMMIRSFETPKESSSLLCEALSILGRLCRFRTAKSFWKKIWNFNDACGLTVLNPSMLRPCSKGLIQIAGSNLAAIWTGKYASYLADAAYCLEEAASKGSKAAKAIYKFLEADKEIYENARLPSKLQRFLAFFNPVLKRSIYSEAAKRIEFSLNSLLLQKLCDAYYESKDEFESLRMIVPWMDEALITLDAMQLTRQSLQAKSDPWIRSKLLRQSAEAGSGFAAYEHYESLPDRTKEEALAFLDTALACNAPQAFCANAYLIENGFRSGSAYSMYLKGVYKGSDYARAGIEAMKSESAWLALKLFFARRLIRKIF
ncbi:MAG: hypothetical protein LBU32_08535 [Clostridiales bacterium]|nr:hypothetical protein [Clostridiales bacterium]